MTEMLIKHPTLGTVAPVQFSVESDLGKIGAVTDRFGCCFYRLETQELIGTIFDTRDCLGRRVVELHVMPWSREITELPLTKSTVKNLTTEVAHKHVELASNGQYAEYKEEVLRKRQQFEAMEAN